MCRQEELLVTWHLGSHNTFVILFLLSSDAASVIQKGYYSAGLDFSALLELYLEVGIKFT